MSKTLIAYYSRADENYVSGALRMLKKGNTKVAAEFIRDLTGADIFEIEQAQPYSKDYNECTEQAKKDKQRNARPELKNYPESLAEYDVIYLGFPNYWGTMPMAVFTFLEKYDLSGKTIKPFCTHEGSGMGNSVSDLKKVCPSANIKDGLAIFGSRVNSSKNDIERWIKL